MKTSKFNFDSQVSSIEAAIKALVEAHRAALFDTTEAGQKPLREEYQAKGEEAANLEAAYEKLKPISEAKQRLLERQADEELIVGNEAKSVELREEAKQVKKGLSDVKAREERCYLRREQIDHEVVSIRKPPVLTEIDHAPPG